MNYFLIVIIVQLFWSFGVTGIAYAIALSPGEQLNYVSLFTNDSTANTLQDFPETIETNTQNQFKIPLVDMATLVFYTGNLIVDLVANFITAFGQMFNLLISGFLFLIPNIDPTISQLFQTFILVLTGVIYVWGFVTTIFSSRSGTPVS